MANRVNRAIELLNQGQAIYYDGEHSGHVLTHEQGRHDAATWADYINVGMEHGAFDMTGLEAYMRGLVDGGPTRSGHRTPAVIVEAPVNGTDEANVISPDPGTRGAWDSAVPGRDRGRGAGVRGGLPVSASSRWC
jgi:4-hydroxy-2-oxoheptanedioate aldolase